MNQNYLVLARKYRPSSFSELRGQEFLVTTIVNAIKLGRIAHAFLLTGIRGVGKTTTARIMAKTFNCTNLIEKNNLVAPCGVCANCQSASDDKHPDIIELDAASRTGVNDIREIIENTNYMPLLGKYKVYIIDEVHMLSTSAFNALLKTLEEPPSHVKFIFSTTENHKIPITILSRCQKFDLRRLIPTELVKHLQDILQQENIEAEEDALKLIAVNSEGSVRDSLSLLDLIIANSNNNKITKDLVKGLLGYGASSKTIDLLQAIILGDANDALNIIQESYYDGKDLLNIIQSLMELVHNISKIKLNIKNNLYEYSDEEVQKITDFAEKLTIPSITIIWQMLHKGLKEIEASSNQLIAIEMLMIRLCYLSNVPTISELVAKIDQNKQVLIHDTVNKPQAKTVAINSFEEIVSLFHKKREMLLYQYLVDDISLVEFDPPRIKIKQSKSVPNNFASKISSLLQEWTGEKWNIILAPEEEGMPTLSAQANTEKENQINSIKNDDLIKEVLQNFKSAHITDVVNQS